jgi:hypothetical protein
VCAGDEVTGGDACVCKDGALGLICTRGALLLWALVSVLLLSGCCTCLAYDIGRLSDCILLKFCTSPHQSV